MTRDEGGPTDLDMEVADHNARDAERSFGFRSCLRSLEWDVADVERVDAQGRESLAIRRLGLRQAVNHRRKTYRSTAFRG